MSRGTMDRIRFGWVTVLVISFAVSVTQADEAEGGRFLRLYWFEKGIEHGNPLYNSRFRVNDPDVALSESFGNRSEVRGNGMMQILMEEELRQLESAELVLELWGGHPGTSGKRVTVNGRSTYFIEDSGTASENCTYSYPAIPLQITDLVNGYNTFQFACDKGRSFWGHFIVDNACLRAVLKKGHPDLIKVKLSEFSATVRAISADGAESINLTLPCSRSLAKTIASVEYQGYYNGYDENGDTYSRDWHGFTKDRKPVAIIGTSQRRPFKVAWDTSMLPEQSNMMIRAIVRFNDPPNLIYITPPAEGLKTPERDDCRIVIFRPYDLPEPFWSRANRKKTCTIEIDTDLIRIERAQLHTVVWDGGRGEVENYFTLNGHPIAIAGEGKHDVIYRITDLDPSWLKRGVNRIELLSDTEHHGIEMLLPGPMIAVREKLESKQ